MGCRHCFVVDLVEEIVGEVVLDLLDHFTNTRVISLFHNIKVAIQVFWSRCQPRSTLSARALHHSKQQVHRSTVICFVLPHWSSCCHEINVLGALLLEGKQQVSPFYRDLFPLREWRSCVHERNVFETCALLLEGKQLVSPFYHPSIHQISTLEKTKFYQYSILNSLMSLIFQRVGGARDWCHGKQQVSTFYQTSQLAHSEDFDFLVWVFTGLSDAVDDRADGGLSMLRAIKLISGLHFALTLSSPDSFCVLFDIASRLLMELKWLMSNKHKRWFHSPRVKFPLVSMSASWFLVSMYLIWFFWVQIDSIEQPIKSNSVGSGKHVSLWDSFTLIVILITASLSSNTYNKASWRADLKEQNECLPSHRSSFETYDVCGHHCQVAPIYLKHEKYFQEQKQLDPIIPEQATHLTQSSVQRDDFKFCWTVRNSSLFLAHPTCWNKCMTSEYAQCSSRSGFRIFKISCEVRVLK